MKHGDIGEKLYKSRENRHYIGQVSSWHDFWKNLQLRICYWRLQSTWPWQILEGFFFLEVFFFQLGAFFFPWLVKSKECEGASILLADQPCHETSWRFGCFGGGRWCFWNLGNSVCFIRFRGAASERPRKESSCGISMDIMMIKYNRTLILWGNCWILTLDPPAIFIFWYVPIPGTTMAGLLFIYHKLFRRLT